MKKLMIAACAVAFAAVAHAANFNWTSVAALNDGGNDSDWEFSGMSYLVQVTDAATFAIADDLTITGGKIINQSELIDSAGGGFFTGDTMFTDGQSYMFAILNTQFGDTEKMATSGLYGVDMNGGNDTESGFYEATWNSATGMAIGQVDSDYYSNIDMQVAPEPTSGLLLLLGVAGLALRRRRA